MAVITINESYLDLLQVAAAATTELICVFKKNTDDKLLIVRLVNDPFPVAF